LIVIPFLLMFKMIMNMIVPVSCMWDDYYDSDGKGLMNEKMITGSHGSNIRIKRRGYLFTKKLEHLLRIRIKW